MKRRYVPERGDLVWLDFYPQSGREQKGRRPALVFSPREYNLKRGLVPYCPITSKVKGYPFKTAVETAGEIRGVILCDQIRSLDWRARRARLIGHASPASLDDALAKVEALLRR